MTCNNCGATFKGNYCPECGQKPNSGRIVLKESARDVVEHYFNLDAPVLRTIKMMMINPGKMIRDYIFGKRKSYSHPFRFYIFSLALYLIVRQLIDFSPIETFSEILGARELPNPDTLQTKGSNFFSTHLNLFLLVYAFTLSGFAKLFNLKEKYYYIEYLSLAFFVIAEYVFANVFVILLTLISPYFFLLNYLFVLVFPIYVLLRFHQKYTFWSVTKTIILAILAWVLYAFIGQFLAIYIVAIFGF